MLPAAMKAVWFDEQGGPERIRFGELPTPEPEVDEVLVRVHAIALNGMDPLVLRGIPALPCPLPMIPCSDGAGEIVRCGRDVDVSRWTVGQKVSIMPIRAGMGVLGESLRGLASQYCAIPQSSLIPLQDSISYTDAACVPTAYSTAYRLITKRLRLCRDERVLILGASGGVGTACVQLALMLGAEVVACAHSEAGLAHLKSLGAHHCIDIRRADVVGEITRLYGKPSPWGGGGVEVAVNLLGGDSWSRSLACLSRGGRLATCGAGLDPQVTMDLRFVWSFEIDVVGSNGWDVHDQTAILSLVAEGRLTPRIHDVRPLSAFREALQDLSEGQVLGKMVLLPFEAQNSPVARYRATAVSARSPGR
ncbi:quinone oxidoreductase family protein [Marinivivus vitaminiproducens]|uniref:quinone oxidoreductase family protein n=1 Tax=Marinivivus vitaminiproducens TaxID=3035935 RepID=UPI00279B376E|nr:zinc-binding dehydrogenase [Geminicoccaceae bacterium SCSIO 64248]